MMECRRPAAVELGGFRVGFDCSVLLLAANASALWTAPIGWFLLGAARSEAQLAAAGR